MSLPFSSEKAILMLVSERKEGTYVKGNTRKVKKKMYWKDNLQLLTLALPVRIDLVGLMKK